MEKQSLGSRGQMELTEIELPLNQARKQAGHGWHFFLPDEIISGDDSENPEQSILQIFEDDVLLGPAHTQHEQIRSVGGGAYSHWKRELFCSTSDNSDIRKSGRRYTVRAPKRHFGGIAEAKLRLASAFKRLVTSRHNYAEISSEEFETSIALALTTIDSIMDLIPAEERELEVMRICGHLDRLTETIFDDINNFSRYSPIYDEAVETCLSRFRDHRSVHLELGTFTVWPQGRVEAYIAQHHLGDFIRLDMNPDFRPDVAASVTALPFADETIDVVSSNSLLEHVPYPHDAIREAFRVLRPGGVMMATVPFHFVAHGCPNDYLRYTGQFFEEVCSAAGFESVLTDTWASSGVYSTLHQLLKGVTAKGAAQSRTGSTGQIVHLTMMSLLGALQTFDDKMVGGGSNHWIGTRAMAVKPGEYISPGASPDRTKPFAERFAESLICPATGLPLRQQEEVLVSADGSRSYDVIDGIPNMFVMHGFGSSFSLRASSRARRAAWEVCVGSR